MDNVVIKKRQKEYKKGSYLSLGLIIGICCGFVGHMQADKKKMFKERSVLNENIHSSGRKQKKIEKSKVIWTGRASWRAMAAGEKER